MILWLVRVHHAPLVFRSTGSQDDGDDETVEGKSLGENHHENDGNKDVAVLVSMDASLAADANSEA